MANTKQFLFALYTLISSDLSTQLVLAKYIDAFFRLFMVYPVGNTTALATFSAVEKWILSLRFPQSIINNRSNAFINTEFNNWVKALGITVRPLTAHSLWTNGQIESQNKHIAQYWRNFLNDAGKKLVFTSNEVCIRPQHKRQLHNWQNTI